jgi:hypothetical protein
LSCGSSPTEANWKIRLSRPMTVGPCRTTCGPILVPAPISTPDPMTEYGPTSTLSWMRASAATIAVA